MTALAAQARELRGRGLSLRQIASATGTGYGTIQALLAPRPPPDPAPEARHCQWICNDRKPWLWCTEPPDRPGGVWCAAHHKVVYSGRGSWS
jgi:transcriptional regulator with XRE-family HTH domain